MVSAEFPFNGAKGKSRPKHLHEQDATGHSACVLNHWVKCSVWPPWRHVWHHEYLHTIKNTNFECFGDMFNIQLASHYTYHFSKGFDCQPELTWPALFWNEAPLVVPMCNKHNEQRGKGFRQLGHDDNLLIFDEAERLRCSS